MQTQKVPRHLALVFVLMLLMFSAAQCDKDDKSEVETFHDDISQLAELAVDFIDKAIAFETTIIIADTEIELVQQVFADYITSGEAFVNSLKKVTGGVGKNNYISSFGKDEPSIQCIETVSGLFDISGLSPAAIKALGDLLESTKNATEAIEKAYANGDIDDAEYIKLMNQLRQEKLLDLAQWGASGMTGVVAAGLVTSAKIAAAGTVGVAAVVTAPALVTIGVVGATTGYVTYRLISWYRQSDKDSESTHITAFSWELNTPFPAFLLYENAQAAISIDGFAPVLIDKIFMPDVGYNMHIEIDAVPISDIKSTGGVGAKSNTPTEVCFIQELAPVNENCADVFFVTAYPQPPNPGPYQHVTVVAHVLPITAGCNIHFSIVGTDGYSNSATHLSDGNGRATFGIPGAMPGVFDLVTITTDSGATQVVSYTFGGSGASGEKEGETRMRTSKGKDASARGNLHAHQ